jgi:hypothetical protein
VRVTALLTALLLSGTSLRLSHDDATKTVAAQLATELVKLGATFVTEGEADFVLQLRGGPQGRFGVTLIESANGAQLSKVEGGGADKAMKPPALAAQLALLLKDRLAKGDHLELVVSGLDFSELDSVTDALRKLPGVTHLEAGEFDHGIQSYQLNSTNVPGSVKALERLQKPRRFRVTSRKGSSYALTAE